MPQHLLLLDLVYLLILWLRSKQQLIIISNGWWWNLLLVRIRINKEAEVPIIKSFKLGFIAGVVFIQWVLVFDF